MNIYHEKTMTQKGVVTEPYLSLYISELDREYKISLRELAEELKPYFEKRVHDEG